MSADPLLEDLAQAFDELGDAPLDEIFDRVEQLADARFGRALVIDLDRERARRRNPPSSGAVEVFRFPGMET